MRPTFRLSEYFAILAVACLPAAAAVTVSFPSPTYTEIGPPGAESDAVKNELARHLHTLDQRYLKPGDNLWIDVIDVDLAGERRWIGGREIRVLRGKADWPRITLRYTLERDGRKQSGEETLSDTAYLDAPASGRAGEQSLYHEKRLLERWFRERFAAARAR
jgi:hypothetical protein